MGNAMATVKGWARDLIDLMLIFIAVGVLVQVIFGSVNWWGFSDVITNLTGVIAMFGEGGFVGLIALLVIISLFNKRATA